MPAPALNRETQAQKLLELYLCARRRRVELEQDFNRKQRLFLRVCERTRLTEREAYLRTGVLAADDRMLDAAKVEQAMFNRIRDALTDVDTVTRYMVAGAIIAAKSGRERPVNDI